MTDPRFTVVGFPGWRGLRRRRDGLMTGISARGHGLGVGTVLFAFAIGPLGHLSLDRLHLRAPPGADLGPGVTGE